MSNTINKSIKNKLNYFHSTTMLTQKFFYPLYRDFDKKLFAKLLDAVGRKYEFIGDEAERMYFVKTLLYYQLVNRNYRKPLRIIYKNLASRTDIEVINSLTKRTEFKKDLSWVVWLFEKEMVKLVNKFWQSKKIKFIGNDTQFNELVLRYLVSIWLVDWAGPCFAIL